MSTYVPPQHGAWAFLALPLVLGAVVTPWTPLLVALAVAWVAAYPMSYAAFGLVRAKRPRRFRAPLPVWSAVVLPAAVILLVERPWLVSVELGYALLFTVNLWYAHRNNERALANDLVCIADCAAMVAVTWAVGAGARSWAPPGLGAAGPGRRTRAGLGAHRGLRAGAPGLDSARESLIRERRDPRFARASRILALAGVPVSIALGAWWGWPSGTWLIAPFVVLAARAFVVPSRPLRPGAIGMIELGCLLLVAGSSVLASQ